MCQAPSTRNAFYRQKYYGEDTDLVPAQPHVGNSPRFAEFETNNGGSVYFRFMEQSTLCETDTHSQKRYSHGLVSIVFFILHM